MSDGFRPAPTHVAAQAGWVLTDPDRPALRWKQDGRWSEASRQEFIADAARVSLALTEMGIRAGDRIGIVGPSNKEWLTAALGAHVAGIVTVGGYPSSPAGQLQYVFGHSGCRVVFVGNAITAHRVLEVADQLDDLERIVVFDTAGLTDSELERVTPFTDLLHPRQIGDGAAVDDFVAKAHALDPGAICTIVYTSGTTGNPKGAVHSFASIGQVTEAVAVPFGYRPDDEYIVHLPLNHLAEQTYSVVLGGQVGWTLNFCESGLTLADDLVAIRPTVMFGVPRLFDKVRESVGESRSPSRAALAPYGMDRLRIAVCGGAPLSADLVRFFAEHGLPMYNTYGMSEAGAIAASWRRNPRPDTCGQPFPGVEVRLDDDGECLIRSSGIMLRYFLDDGATAKAMTDDGYFRTGDIGRWTPDGDLELVDRKKDIIITGGGKNIAPSPIEHAMASSALINAAVVIGNDRKYLVALFVLDPVAAALFVERPDAQLATLVEDPFILEAIDKHVAAVNADLSQAETIKRWSILPRVLEATDPELTPTMKIKRRAFEERYGPVIDALYS